MIWNHQRVYDALSKRRYYQKEGERDVYVSLDHHRLRELSMVLYRPDAESYKSSPLHINKGRIGFSSVLFERIADCIEKTSRGEPDWVRYRVKDWDKLAEGLGL